MKKPIFWIDGNHFDCQSAISQIIGKHKDANVVVLDGSSDRVDRVFANLMEREIFASSSKIIRLKGLPDGYELIYEYLKYVGKNRVLIIESPLASKVGRRNINASNSKLYKEIKKTGKVCMFPTVVSESKAMTWTKRVFKNFFQKEIDDDALSMLVKLKNNNLNFIYSDLQKLNVYLDSRETAKLADINICMNHIEFDIWSFIENLIDGKIEESIVQLEKYFVANEHFVYEVDKLMSLLCSRFELLLFARQIGQFVSKRELWNFVRNMKKRTRKTKTTKKIKKIEEEDIEDHKNEKEYKVLDKYSEKFIDMFISSFITRNFIKKTGGIKIARILSTIYFVGNSFRASNNDPTTCKILLLNLCKVVCGQIESDDFYLLYNSRNKMMLPTF